MEEKPRRLRVAIYRMNPGVHYNVNELDLGSLLGPLMEEPFYFAKVGEEGEIKLEVQRTHEWEFLLGIVIAGSAIFLKAALQQLGKHFADWLAKTMGMLQTSVNPEIQTANSPPIVIQPSAVEGSSEDIARLLEAAAEKGHQVRLIVEPRS